MYKRKPHASDGYVRGLRLFFADNREFDLTVNPTVNDLIEKPKETFDRYFGGVCFSSSQSYKDRTGDPLFPEMMLFLEGIGPRFRYLLFLPEK
ncbi:hypothetical protein DVH26_13645 [Paenibacillus sp. H1-7]|nr:hypothetical protein DVH26_13645 [Paenibacillus sp. H1-7]